MVEEAVVGGGIGDPVERDICRCTTTTAVCHRCAAGLQQQRGEVIDEVHENEAGDERQPDACVRRQARVRVRAVGPLLLAEAGAGVERLDALGDDDDERRADEDAHAQCGYQAHVQCGKRERQGQQPHAERPGGAAVSIGGGEGGDREGKGGEGGLLYAAAMAMLKIRRVEKLPAMVVLGLVDVLLDPGCLREDCIYTLHVSRYMCLYLE